MMSKRHILVPAVVVALSCGLATADVIVASNFTPSFQYSGFREDIGYWSNINNRPSNTATSQRFVPSHSGVLSTLTVFGSRGVGGEPLRLAIHQDQSGKPGSMLGQLSLGESTFPTSYFPPNLPTALNLSTLAIQLNAGTPYHVVFRTDTAVFHNDRYSLHMLTPHAGSFDLPYLYSPDGTATWQNGAFSLEVAMQVAIIPEPASAAAFCLALTFLVTGGRACRGSGRWNSRSEI